MALSLTVLGSNAAMPAYGRITSAQVLHSNNFLYLIDCGEGTRIRLSEYKIKRNKIAVIFISHLHGDHCFGLPGVISSFFHFSRSQKLKIIGPVGIKKLINTFMEVSEGHLMYELEIIEHTADTFNLIYQNKDLEVYAFPLKHRIKTNGYLFRELQRDSNLIKEKITEFNLTIEEMRKLKKGLDIQRPNELILADEVTKQKTPAKSFAYCSDTIYDESLIDIVREVDLLYHETTYLHELKEKARARMHATSYEAAQLAKAASVSRLLIGHYSGMYRTPDALLDEAQSVFENSIAAYDGLMIDI